MSLIEVEWLSVKDARLLSVEDDWEMFKSLILRSTEEIIGYSRIKKER